MGHPLYHGTLCWDGHDRNYISYVNLKNTKCRVKCYSKFNEKLHHMYKPKIFQLKFKIKILKTLWGTQYEVPT